MEAVQSVLNIEFSDFFFCRKDVTDAYFYINVTPEFNNFF